jgi:glutamine amidotransferase
MCELFAMSTRHPATVTLSFAELARHGGLVGPHRDGWGLAYYEGRDAHLFREAAPAATSASLRFLQEHPFTATTVVGHIRRATQGPRALANSQPFVRELGGHAHVFAHNGDLTGLADVAPAAPYQPIGDTDSERAFCALLERLRPLWQVAGGVPALDARLAAVAAFAASVRPLGPANFVYADGDAIFVHAHRRNQGDARGVAPPGLHLLCRRCAAEPGTIAGLDLGAAPQDVVLVASVPLSDERWLPLAEGEVVVLTDGARVASASADGVGRGVDPPRERISR